MTEATVSLQDGGSILKHCAQYVVVIQYMTGETVGQWIADLAIASCSNTLLESLCLYIYNYHKFHF